MKASIKKAVSVALVLMLALTALFVIPSAADAVKRDIYLVLDVSGTMTGKHMDRLKNDAKLLSDSLLNKDETGVNRIAVIAYNDNATVYDFTSDYDTVAATIDSLSASGKADINKALNTVKEVRAAQGDPDAQRHVVIMSDGVLTAGDKSKDGKYKLTDSLLYSQYANPAYATAEAMWPEYAIYTVGVTLCFGGTEFKFRQRFLKDIENNLFQEEYNNDEMIAAIIAGKYSPMPEPESETAAPTTEAPVPTTEAPAPTTAAPATEAPTEGKKGLDIDFSIDGIKDKCNEICDKIKGLIPSGKPKDEGTTAAQETKTNIAQTGSTTAAIAVAAIVMVAGAAFVATKKRER